MLLLFKFLLLCCVVEGEWSDDDLILPLLKTQESKGSTTEGSAPS